MARSWVPNPAAKVGTLHAEHNIPWMLGFSHSISKSDLTKESQIHRPKKKQQNKRNLLGKKTIWCWAKASSCLCAIISLKAAALPLSLLSAKQLGGPESQPGVLGLKLSTRGISRKPKTWQWPGKNELSQVSHILRWKKEHLLCAFRWCFTSKSAVLEMKSSSFCQVGVSIYSPISKSYNATDHQTPNLRGSKKRKLRSWESCESCDFFTEPSCHFSMGFWPFYILFICIHIIPVCLTIFLCYPNQVKLYTCFFLKFQEVARKWYDPELR